MGGARRRLVEALADGQPEEALQTAPQAERAAQAGEIAPRTGSRRGRARPARHRCWGPGVSAARRRGASIRYWAMNSISISPPARCFRSNRRSPGCCCAMRRRMAATSPASFAGSRGRVRIACSAVSTSCGEAAVAGDHPCARERHMLPGPGIGLLIAPESPEAGGDRPGIARGPQPHVDLIEPALAGGRGDGGDHALRQAGVVMDRRQRLRPVGHAAYPSPRPRARPARHR